MSYNAIPVDEQSPLKSDANSTSAMEDMIASSPGSVYLEKTAAVITTNRRKRPLYSLFLGVVFVIIVVSLGITLVRRYSTYSIYRQTHDIPRRVNVTEMYNGDYYRYTSFSPVYPSPTSLDYEQLYGYSSFATSTTTATASTTPLPTDVEVDY
ncbi:hypothetical protein V1511DRAFT_486527 [Dipodascopsis uninucleata]